MLKFYSIPIKWDLNIFINMLSVTAADTVIANYPVGEGSVWVPFGLV